MQAKDVMTTQVVSVSETSTVYDVALTLLDCGISAAPVLDAKGKLVGIVSEGDLMRRDESGTTHRRSWWLDMLTTRDELASQYVKEHGRRAADVMTRNVITVTPDTELSEVANLLERHSIKRLPVVEEGRLVGLISRANLIQALAALHDRLPSETSADDAAIRDEVIARLRGEPWTPLLLNVIVKDGAVGLWGFVRSADEKDAARVAAESVRGARAVDDNLILMRAGMMGT